MFLLNEFQFVMPLKIWRSMAYTVWITGKGIEREICLRQLAMKAPTESSWFNRIRKLLNQYDLPSPSELMENPPSKLKWKSAVDNAICRQVEETWREDIQGKHINIYKNILIQIGSGWDR